jgi:hypothetical protein
VCYSDYSVLFRLLGEYLVNCNLGLTDLLCIVYLIVSRGIWVFVWLVFDASV